MHFQPLTNKKKKLHNLAKASPSNEGNFKSKQVDRFTLKTYMNKNKNDPMTTIRICIPLILMSIFGIRLNFSLPTFSHFVIDTINH